ncbi:MAG: mitochondrial fission ELM1 family protein [Pseudomonadota bacterium]
MGDDQHPSAPRTAWIVTDGKAGDVVQCAGVCEVMGVAFEPRVVAPRAPFVWLMPHGPMDPREHPERSTSPLAPPFPDLVVGSGRRAVPYIRWLTRKETPRPFTMFLKDPRTGSGVADAIWVPAHDRLRGANVLATLTSPHRVHADRLAEARANPDTAIANVPPPRVAVLIGGDGPNHRFTGENIATLLAHLRTLAKSGAHLMGTLSRRTETSDPALANGVTALFGDVGGYLWDGSGENPYLTILANADAVVVTTDSVNMIGEAAATGKPVLTFAPSPRKAGRSKFSPFLEGLAAHGVVKPFTGRLETFTYAPINATPQIADWLLERYRASRSGDQPHAEEKERPHG